LTATRSRSLAIERKPVEQSERLLSEATVDQEGKQAVKMTRLSCHRFRSNEVRHG
jgi:hypothetical protein